MLTNLRVQNFAIIDNISIEFGPGLTIMTGETGAGKSLIIDAIGLLFGDRSSTSIVRHGETKAIVEGVFENFSLKTKKILEEIGIDLIDEMLVIKREINVNGKSIIRVNGDIITLNQLEMLGLTLGDIHTQDDTKKLFLPENYLSFIDNSESLDLLEKYHTLRNIYLKNIKKYQSLIKEQQSSQTNKDFWLFQYQELNKADLKVNELESLEKEVEYLNNYETIYKLLLEIREKFTDQDLTDSLYAILGILKKLVSYNEKYQKYYQVVNDAYYNIDDFEDFIKNEFNHLDFDEQHLNSLNERISYLKNLMHKYHLDMIGLISFKDELAQRINNIENMDVYLEDALHDVEVSYQNLGQISLNLTKIRKNNSELLVKNIKNTLNDLLLTNVELKIKFNDYVLENPLNYQLFREDGCDEVDFFVSFNVGETLKPLSKVASGGEMSRFMLALKVHMLKNLHLSTIIFDEIDSGVSGEVAAGVGKKMKEISEKTQVLAITHLPIVASVATTQMHITKDIVNNRTITLIKTLDQEERINVLAQMLSPNDQTNKSMELARSWLEKVN